MGTENETEAVDLLVTGRVQGVFYRAGLRDRARALGVAGWARNEPDGTVRVHLEGAADALAQVLEWCATGTPAARVEDVARHPGQVTGASGFETA